MSNVKRDRAYPRSLHLSAKDLPRLREIIETFRTPGSYVGTSIVNGNAIVHLKLRKRDLLMIKLSINISKTEKQYKCPTRISI